MKLNQPWLTRAMSVPLWLGVRSWMSTLDYRVWYANELVDPTRHPGPPRLYLFWHEGILMPLHLRGHCHVTMLLSKHRDADFLGQIAGRFGFECVRGSTKRGGVAAVRALVRAAKTNHLTMTPDGPRGPRRVLAPGPIYLASLLQMPIVLFGFGYQNPWRTRSWDRFAIPKPFSRARAIVSDEIFVPPKLDREQIEDWRIRIEQMLGELTEDAEQWADTGDRRDGEQRLHRASADPPLQKRSVRRAA